MHRGGCGGAGGGGSTWMAMCLSQVKNLLYNPAGRRGPEQGRRGPTHIHTPSPPGIRHFHPRISDHTGWYLQYDFQFSVRPTVLCTYTTNVPTLVMFFYSWYREQRPLFDLLARKCQYSYREHFQGSPGIFQIPGIFSGISG